LRAKIQVERACGWSVAEPGVGIAPGFSWRMDA
jgi:hypothetical protein